MIRKNTSSFVRAHVFYGGRVQGVGFRYTAERLALDLDLVGWVKNLPDGRVEIVCEGPRSTVEALLKNIRDSLLAPYIKKADCKWEEPTREFKDFRVEFCY
jgi:acylphosphatase